MRGPKDRAVNRRRGSEHPGYDKDLGYVPDTYENRTDPNQSEDDWGREKVEGDSEEQERGGAVRR